jgi:RNA polymerase sigma-70 factor
MSNTANLDEAIVALYSEGYSRFGDLGLGLKVFDERVRNIARKYLGSSPTTDEALAFISSLHGRDLYLTTACAQNGLGAQQSGGKISAQQASIPWKTFEATYKGHIHNLARLFHHPGFIADDLADSVLADLFLPDRSGVSRIASYDGRSTLATWLRVVVCNRAINVHRSSNDNSPDPDILAKLEDLPALQNIDFAVRAARYGPALKDSIATACRGLTPRERLMLLWRYEHELQLGQIARLLGIHQSNVTRQLEQTQSKLREKVISILAARHRLSRSAIQECLQDIVDNPAQNISLIGLIKLAQKPATDDESERRV